MTALVTLAPAAPAAFVDDALATAALDRSHAPWAARVARTAQAARAHWWQWLDFDSKVLAQVWVICCTQILILVVAGLVIHASAASPY
jgi:hypothetical protein